MEGPISSGDDERNKHQGSSEQGATSFEGYSAFSESPESSMLADETNKIKKSQFINMMSERNRPILHHPLTIISKSNVSFYNIVVNESNYLIFVYW